MVDPDIAVIAFDLDDTLYLERDFARSGFKAVGRHVEDRYGIAKFADRCLRLLDLGIRGSIFDRALTSCGIPFDECDIGELVQLYRGHSPEIALLDDADRLLAFLDVPTALITDGPEAMQRAKIAALGLDRRINLIIPTGMWNAAYSKPHPRGFIEVERWSGQPGHRHVYVADNPKKDFLAPRRRGWTTVQIVREHGIHETAPPSPDHEADYVVESLLDLPFIDWKGRLSA